MITAYHNAYIIDGTGNSFTGYLVIENDKIHSIGEGNLPSEIDADARHDLNGQTILPGMIDCHVHLYSDGDADPMRSRAQDTGPLAAIRAARNAVRTIQGGVTTVRDCGSRDGVDFALRRAALEEICIAPRMLLCGCMICMTGGHGVGSGLEADGVDGVRKAARLMLKQGADHIKLVASGGILSSGTEIGVAQFTVEEMRAGVDEAHRAGKTACAHAHGTQAIKNAILAGVNSIEHGYLIDDEGIDMMLDRDTFLVATSIAVRNVVEHGVEAGIPEHSVRKARSAINHHISGFKKALSAGVKMAMGTDSGVPFTRHGRNLQELVCLVDMGMTPMQAIMTATLHAAELIQMKDQIGSLEKGKYADFIVVDGNPLNDIALLTTQSNIHNVFIGGKEIYKKGVTPLAN